MFFGLAIGLGISATVQLLRDLTQDEEYRAFMVQEARAQVGRGASAVPRSYEAVSDSALAEHGARACCMKTGQSRRM